MGTVVELEDVILDLAREAVHVSSVQWPAWSQSSGFMAWWPMRSSGGAAILAASALLASFVPARRAARINPLEALRQD